MDLIAKKRCFYRVWREPGERFTADRARGRALVKLKHAALAPQTAPRTYSTRAVPAAATERVVMTADSDLKALRSEYKAVTGRLPHHTWDADKLREKLAFS